MADTKISAFPAATNVVNADELPIVQTLVNAKVTRSLLLTGGTGEDIQVVSSLNQRVVLRTDTGQELISVDDVFGCLIIGTFGISLMDVGASALIQLTGAGALNLNSTPGQAVTVGSYGAANASMTMPGGAGPIVFTANQGMTCPFVIQAPGAVGNWAVGVPADYNLAINRLAAAVAGLLGGPIP